MRESSKKFEVLLGFPHTEEEVVCFGGQPFYSEGLIIRFFKNDGNSWIANIGGPSSGQLKKTYRLTESKVLALVGNEYFFKAYIFDSNDNNFEYDLGFGFTDIFETTDKIVLCELTRIKVIEADGSIWNSKRISWDGLKEIVIDNNLLNGLAYYPMDKSEEWIPFILNLDTRVVEGGSYPQPKQ